MSVMLFSPEKMETLENLVDIDREKIINNYDREDTKGIKDEKQKK